MLNKIKEILQNYRRVLAIARKPNRDEFIESTKICALGMVLIGLIAFLFYLMAVLIGL